MEWLAGKVHLTLEDAVTSTLGQCNMRERIANCFQPRVLQLGEPCSIPAALWLFWILELNAQNGRVWSTACRSQVSKVVLDMMEVRESFASPTMKLL